MSVFLLALVGPAAVETSLLFMGFVDAIPPPPLFFTKYTLSTFFFFFLQYLFGQLDIVDIVWVCNF